MNKWQVKNKMQYWQHRYPAWISAVSVLALLLLWEIICSMGFVSSLFLPSPVQIIAALADMLLSGELAASLGASLYRILTGFVIGSAIGLGAGLLAGISSLNDRIITPVINSLYPIPKIALLPLFVLWLGIGEMSKITIIAAGVFFPVAMNTYAGVKNVDPLLLKVAVSFNADKARIIRSVILPSALPMIFTGLKLAAGTSLLLLVAAEMIAAQVGIGALILHYGDLMITDRLMGGVLVLSLLGIVFNVFLTYIEKKLIPWKN